jgi:hypothetical protein
MDLVAQQMRSKGPTGSILEIGAAAGRLFDHLHKEFPNWRYGAVDPWEMEQVRLQIYWNKDYFEPGNLGELITKRMFTSNCPFAEANRSYFEDWNTEEKFDVVSMGLVGPKVRWHDAYQKASRMLKEDGIIVGRNAKHKKYGEYVEQAVRNLQYSEIDRVGESMALLRNDIRYGSYDIALDIDKCNAESNQLLEGRGVKTSGMRDFNQFISTPPSTKLFLSKYMNNILGTTFDWNFEYFRSGEPAGLHTDYLSVPNSWRPKEEGMITHDCHIVIGVIIPLEWNCKQPYTVSYDRIATEPRKLKFKGGEMRYVDNDEIVPYRTKWEYDPDVMQYNPMKTEYYKEYADLKLHSVYEWKKGTMLVFNTARWHSSSWYLSTNSIPEVSTEYKKSVIGFGSIDVDRNRD